MKVKGIIITNTQLAELLGFPKGSVLCQFKKQGGSEYYYVHVTHDSFEDALEGSHISYDRFEPKEGILESLGRK